MWMDRIFSTVVVWKDKHHGSRKRIMECELMDIVVIDYWYLELDFFVLVIISVSVVMNVIIGYS